MKRINQKNIDNLFAENPLLAFEAAKFKQRILNKEVDEILLHSFMQKHEKYNDVNLYDAHYLKELFELYDMGLLGIGRIKLDDTPFSNRAVDENNAVLSQLLPKFKVEFIPETGAGAEDDGYFSLLEGTIEITYKDGTKKDIEMLSVPLEVGTTESDTTYQHLWRNGGLARWAYHSKEVIILHLPTTLKLMTRSNTFNKAKKEISTPFYSIDENTTREDLKRILDDINLEIQLQSIPTNLYLNYERFECGGLGIIDFSKFEYEDMDSGRLVINCLSNKEISNNHWIISKHRFFIRLSIKTVDYDFLAINVTFGVPYTKRA